MRGGGGLQRAKPATGLFVTEVQLQGVVERTAFGLHRQQSMAETYRRTELTPIGEPCGFGMALFRGLAHWPTLLLASFMHWGRIYLSRR